jgi:serine/threonine-protein kinase
MYVACPRCGQQNYNTATQCAYCGSGLAAAPQGFAQTNAPGFSAGATGPGPGQEAGPGASQPQVGQIIDRKYRVERVLGEGGMGVVYVAHDVNADQKVVIKSIRPEFANRGDFRERTMAEGRALAKIDHQNVVRFNSIVNSPETNELYIVMQFIEGESLDRTLEKANAAGQKLPVPEVLRIFKMTLDGVGAAHREGLMHRDLKPANIIVRTKDGVAKVMDFGIAKAEGSTKGPTQAGGIVGSLWYMAPEQIKGARDLDKRLDVYALGIVLYELVTGVVPFDGETEYDIMTKHIGEAVPSVRVLRPDAPPWIDEVIAKATSKDRANRYQSCEEMRAAIDHFDGGLVVPRSMTAYENSIVDPGAPARGTAAMTPPPVYQTAEPSMPSTPKKGPPVALFAAIGAVVVIGGVGAAIAMGKGDKKPDAVAKKPPVEDHGGDDEKKKAVQDKKTAEKPKKKDPLDAIVGDWETDTTNRALKAVRDGDEVVFRVVNPKDWDGAYAEDEIRFRLKQGEDDKTFEVEDRYRPSPGHGKTYTKGALASCIVESSGNVKNTDLRAILKSESTLEVTFALANVELLQGANDTVTGCRKPSITGTVRATLRRK